jgi:hypothetical protein
MNLEDKIHVLHSRHRSQFSFQQRDDRYIDVPSLIRYSLLCNVSLLRRDLGQAQTEQSDTTTKASAHFRFSLTITFATRTSGGEV